MRLILTKKGHQRKLKTNNTLQKEGDSLDIYLIFFSDFDIPRQQAKTFDLDDVIPRHVYLHHLSRKWLEHRFAARQMQDEKEMEHW